jgi:hypothetical protein
MVSTLSSSDLAHPTLGLEPVPHIAHTWGMTWPEERLPSSRIRYIIASDILLYVRSAHLNPSLALIPSTSAYPALVETLLALFYGPDHAAIKFSNHPSSPFTTGRSLDDSLAPYVINLSSSTAPSSHFSYDLYDSGARDFFPSVPSADKVSEDENQFPVEFLMSWNRRISESYQFFALMKEAGFVCYHHGRCLYSFVPKTCSS